MSTKLKGFTIKAVDESLDYQFEGYASTYGNVDRDKDIFIKGAFDKTLQTKNTYPLLFNHDRNSVIGKIEASTDNMGLFVKGYLNLNDSKAQNVYDLLKMGALNSMSVGFSVKDYDPVDPNKPFGGWQIKEAELYEVSIATIPANERAIISTVKSLKEKEEFYDLIKKALREVIQEERKKDLILNQIKNLKEDLK